MLLSSFKYCSPRFLYSLNSVHDKSWGKPQVRTELSLMKVKKNWVLGLMKERKNWVLSLMKERIGSYDGWKRERIRSWVMKEIRNWVFRRKKEIKYHSTNTHTQITQAIATIKDRYWLQWRKRKIIFRKLYSFTEIRNSSRNRDTTKTLNMRINQTSLYIFDKRNRLLAIKRTHTYSKSNN